MGDGPLPGRRLRIPCRRGRLAAAEAVAAHGHERCGCGEAGRDDQGDSEAAIGLTTSRRGSACGGGVALLAGAGVGVGTIVVAVAVAVAVGVETIVVAVGVAVAVGVGAGAAGST